MAMALRDPAMATVLEDLATATVMAPLSTRPVPLVPLVPQAVVLQATVMSTLVDPIVSCARSVTTASENVAVSLASAH